MAFIVYEYADGVIARGSTSSSIRWLNVDDYTIFIEHLKLCGQKGLERSTWDEIYARGDRYVGFFINNLMVSRAAVEKYSDTAWEVGDVRTAMDYRNHGYAYQVCDFVLQYICDNHMTATMRTEEANYRMQRIIERLGFVKI